METLGRDGWRTSLEGRMLLVFAYGGRRGDGWYGVGLEYAHDHLLAAQEGVANELARAQGHLSVGHDCGGGVGDGVVGCRCRPME